MKLRNLLLTSALFLAAGAAFAESFVNYEDYSWNNKNNKKTIEVTLTKFENQGGFTYSVYDVDAYNQIVDGKSFNNENQKSKYALDELKKINKVWDLKDPGANNSLVTVIDLPEGTSVANFGVIGKEKIYSVPNISNNSYFYQLDGTPANIVYFGAITPTNNGLGNDRSAMVTFGQPLPAPLVTLLIALGFGAALVMYRNRKQAKA